MQYKLVSTLSKTQFVTGRWDAKLEVWMLASLPLTIRVSFKWLFFWVQIVLIISHSRAFSIIFASNECVQ